MLGYTFSVVVLDPRSLKGTQLGCLFYLQLMFYFACWGGFGLDTKENPRRVSRVYLQSGHKTHEDVLTFEL